MPATVVGSVLIDDERLGRHFGHHSQYATRAAGHEWKFSLVQVPIEALRCLYDDPGVSDTNPVGLMGSVGASPHGHHGARIVDLAARIAATLVAGQADTSNPALSKIMALRDGGLQVIRAADEPAAVSMLEGAWFVREGTHRAIAQAMLSVPFIEAIDFESGQLT